MRGENFMLLNIYLGSIVLTWSILKLRSNQLKKRLKREGYVILKKKKTMTKRIFDIVQTTIEISLPVYNLMGAYAAIVRYDSIAEKTKQALIENGIIQYPTASKVDENKQESPIGSKQSHLRESHIHEFDKEKLELYLANKKQIDAYYAYMRGLVQMQLENQTVSQIPPIDIDIDNLSLGELQSLVAQIKWFQSKEETESQKTKF